MLAPRNTYVFLLRRFGTLRAEVDIAVESSLVSSAASILVGGAIYRRTDRSFLPSRILPAAWKWPMLVPATSDTNFASSGSCEQQTIGSLMSVVSRVGLSH